MYFRTIYLICFVISLLTVTASAAPLLGNLLCTLLKPCPPAAQKCPKGQHFEPFKKQKRRMMNPVAAAAALLGICVEDVLDIVTVPDLPVPLPAPIPSPDDLVSAPTDAKAAKDAAKEAKKNT